MTTASASRRSHLRGARRRWSVPSDLGESGFGSSKGSAPESASASASASAATLGKRSRSGASHRRGSVTLAVGGLAVSISGSSPRERYSLKRLADRPSAAQPSKARNARPEGSGRVAPREKCVGISARSSASVSGARYACGARSSTAMRSNAIPARAKSRARRAISTHSRFSPGADRTAIDSVSAGCGLVDAIGSASARKPWNRRCARRCKGLVARAAAGS